MYFDVLWKQQKPGLGLALWVIFEGEARDRKALALWCWCFDYCFYRFFLSLFVFCVLSAFHKFYASTKNDLFNTENSCILQKSFYTYFFRDSLYKAYHWNSLFSFNLSPREKGNDNDNDIVSMLGLHHFLSNINILIALCHLFFFFTRPTNDSSAWPSERSAHQRSITNNR